jgi:hypothetical protein
VAGNGAALIRQSEVAKSTSPEDSKLSTSVY